jgi:hypothetical protein
MKTFYKFDSQNIFSHEIESNPLLAVPKNSTVIEPPATTANQVARFIGDGWEVLDERPEVIVPAEPIPPIVTMAQARKAMILSGVSIANVDAAIDGIADAQEKLLAQTDWEYSTTVRRDSDLVISLAPALNLTTEQVDAMFVLAHTI